MMTKVGGWGARFRIAAILVAAFAVFLVPAACAQGYTVTPGYSHPPPAGAVHFVPEPVPIWSLPLWILVTQAGCIPLETFATFKLWLALGFRRVRNENVLDQDVRSRVFSHIKENPGIHMRGLAEEMHLKLGTLRYHLKVLRLTHKITVAEDPASVRFYENSGTYSETQQQVLKHLRNPTTRKILGILLKRPAATRQEIAGAVGITGPSITWHMKRLEEDHLIIMKRDGRSNAYALLPPVSRYLAERMGIPAQPGNNA
ncbi:MAG: winged helix-turn-helix transcriptional regulator [Methanoregula sp.]|jgi:predicted transcriptional regulator